MQHKKELLNQSQIADKLGVNRSTVSRLLKDNDVAPQQVNGRQKFYDATIVQQLKNTTNRKNIAKKSNAQHNELLERIIVEQREEIKELREQIKDKDEIIKSNNTDLVELSKELANLTSQAQQLNLLDKPRQVKANDEDVVANNENETTSATKKHRWWNFRK